MHQKPAFSIIVATKNNERTILSCLQSIKAQTFKSLEIIIVDNYSKDNTCKIARDFTEIILSHGPERSSQRNYGAENSNGSYVYYLDADMTLSPRLLEEANEVLEKDKDLIGLYVPLRWVGQNWIIKARGFEREFYDSTALDAVRIIRRSTFLLSGGFDKELYAGEDWDLNRTLQKYGKFSSIKSIMYHLEDEDLNLRQFVLKCWSYSDNLLLYVKKRGRTDIVIKKQLGFYYRFIKVFTEDGKWKKLLRHPVLTGYMYFLKILTATIFIVRSVRAHTPLIHEDP